MSLSLVRTAYLAALAFAASRLSTATEVREFAEFYVGELAKSSDVRDWPTVASAFAEWARDLAFASFAA